MQRLKFPMFSVLCLLATIGNALAELPLALAPDISFALTPAELTEVQRAELQQSVAEAIGLHACQLDLIPRLANKDELTVRVEAGHAAHVFELKRYSLRSPDFSLLADDGTVYAVDPPPVQTYRGASTTDLTLEVAASVTADGQLIGMIVPANGDPWYVEPLAGKISGAPADWHVVYRGTDVKPADVTCGVGGDMALLATQVEEEILPPASVQGGGSLTQIAFDADVEFYQLHGSSMTETLNDIELIANLVEHIYHLQVDICYSITGIIVRTAEPDPYSATGSSPLLCQFTTHWNNTNPFSRDVAHLMTGKNLVDAIGVAWVQGICDGNANLSLVCPGLTSAVHDYGLSESLFLSPFPTNLAERVSLTAHELGHNWSACHCNQSSCTGGVADPDCGIMFSFVTPALEFGSRSRNAITAFRNSRPCLGTCGSGPADCDGDGISNVVEIATGSQQDCNGNSVPDDCDILGGTPDCNGNGIPDTCDIAGTFTDCTGNGVLDVCENSPDCNGNGKADFNDICLGSAADCNGNGTPDFCDVASATSPDCNSNNNPDECDIGRGWSFDCNVSGIPDECESANCPAEVVLFDVNVGGDRSSVGPYEMWSSTAQHGGVGALSSANYTLENGFWHAVNAGPTALPPLPASAPHDRRKNRYISFVPNNAAAMVAFRVQKTTAPTGSCWVQIPVQTGVDQFTAKCDGAPVFRVWDEPVVHVGDCEIVPVADYQIFASAPGPVETPMPLLVQTSLLPSLNSKLWGDAVGSNNGVEWTPPNQFTNVQDVLAILSFITNAAIQPHFTVANLQSISAPDSCLNAFINTADVLISVRAIAGDSYGPPSSGKIVDPTMCAVCP